MARQPRPRSRPHPGCRSSVRSSRRIPPRVRHREILHVSVWSDYQSAFAGPNLGSPITGGTVRASSGEACVKMARVMSQAYGYIPQQKGIAGGISNWVVSGIVINHVVDAVFRVSQFGTLFAEIRWRSCSAAESQGVHHVCREQECRSHALQSMQRAPLRYSGKAVLSISSLRALD